MRLYGYNPQKAILFGSFAQNQPTKYSDIDLAVWDSRFTGCTVIDYEVFKSLLGKFPLIELHTFSLDEDDNPLIPEIEKNGINLLD